MFTPPPVERYHSPMPTMKKKIPALNPRQQAFADAYLSGVPAGRAYVAAGYTKNKAAADVEASKMLRKPAVKAYLKACREKLDKVAEVTREEVLKYLSDIIRTAPGTLDETSPLVQEYLINEIAGGVIQRRVKMPCKLDACKIICRMMGWEAPQQVEVAADDALTSLLLKIRSGSR
jgi:hypothetical protein